MSVEKFSISFDPELGQAIRDAADADDDTVSAWLAEAARARLRTLVLGQSIDAALHDLGLSEDEVLEAARLARLRAVVVSGRPTKVKRSPRSGPASTTQDRAPGAGTKSGRSTAKRPVG